MATGFPSGWVKMVDRQCCKHRSWLCAVPAKTVKNSCQARSTREDFLLCCSDHFGGGRSEEAGLDPSQAICILSPGWVLHSAIPLRSLISNGKVFYCWVAAGCSPSTLETGIVTQAKLKSAWVHTGEGETNCQELNPEHLTLSCLVDISLSPLP